MRKTVVTRFNPTATATLLHSKETALEESIKVRRQQ